VRSREVYSLSCSSRDTISACKYKKFRVLVKRTDGRLQGRGRCLGERLVWGSPL